MSFTKQIEYWLKSSDNDWATAKILFDHKKYDQCLFFCHLCLEKILKSRVVSKIHKPAPFIHDLDELAKLAGLRVSAKQARDLRLITTFNIAGRYADAKLQLYKKATQSFTQKHLNLTNDLRLWLQKKYQKK